MRDCAGIPREKSMRGKGRGVTSNVASQFTMPTASWLAAIATRSASATSVSPVTPSPYAFTDNAAVSATVIAAIVPR